MLPFLSNLPTSILCDFCHLVLFEVVVEVCSRKSPFCQHLLLCPGSGQGQGKSLGWCLQQMVPNSEAAGDSWGSLYLCKVALW